ncbi:unnamed protein product [Caenorhabditis auriculariae]|uniref:Peptidase M13 C-terminal domain-containing protein n=1 Tax=Caenorhabditis auriculariae TaxID=2777116 RepID=A0A8S1H7S4_9PELO|nr:unnamed protein product [Caenorhabditis auriculariae]
MQLLVVSVFLVSLVVGQQLQLNLNTILNGIDMHADNMTLSFKNLDVHNGSISFDELLVNGVRPLLTGNSEATPASLPRNLTDLPIFESTTTSMMPSVGNNKYMYQGLVNSIDPSVNPCDDFYAHVCNGWMATHPLEEGDPAVSQFALVSGNVVVDKYSLLASEDPPTTREQGLAKTFYNICVEHFLDPDNTTFLSVVSGLAATRKLPWNPLTNWMINFSPQSFIYEVVIAADERDATKNVLQVSPRASLLSYEAYTDNSYVYEYTAMRKFLCSMLDIAEVEDEDREVFKGNAMDYVNRVNAFFRVDRGIAEALHPSAYNKSTSHIPFYQLNQHTWQELGDGEVQILDSQGMANLETFLMTLDDETLEMYLDFYVIFAYGDYLDSRFQNASQQYEIETTGGTTTDIGVKCVSAASDAFGDVLDQMYIEKNFPNTTRPQIRDMIENIRESFRQSINESKWMDEQTKQKALTKLSEITPYIGYNDKIFDQTSMTEKYKKLNFTKSDSYLSASMGLLKLRNNQNIALFGVKNNRSLDFAGADVNAYYEPTTNSIAILAGILQPPIINTGAIGAIIGHELTHGFDSSGATYDGEGNRVNWWDSQTLAQFENKTTCFKDQYGNVTVTGTNSTINGRLTVDENIADNGGLHITINAAKKLSSQRNDVISGLESLSQMQMFFLSYGYVWCNAARPQQIMTDLQSDVHSPGKYRVNVVLSNQPEFASAFNCAPGTPMNPVNTCSIRSLVPYPLGHAAHGVRSTPARARRCASLLYVGKAFHSIPVLLIFVSKLRAKKPHPFSALLHPPRSLHSLVSSDCADAVGGSAGRLSFVISVLAPAPSDNKQLKRIRFDFKSAEGVMLVADFAQDGKKQMTRIGYSMRSYSTGWVEFRVSVDAKKANLTLEVCEPGTMSRKAIETFQLTDFRPETQIALGDDNGPVFVTYSIGCVDYNKFGDKCDRKCEVKEEYRRLFKCDLKGNVRCRNDRMGQDCKQYNKGAEKAHRKHFRYKQFGKTSVPGILLPLTVHSAKQIRVLFGANFLPLFFRPTLWDRCGATGVGISNRIVLPVDGSIETGAEDSCRLGHGPCEKVTCLCDYGYYGEHCEFKCNDKVCKGGRRIAEKEEAEDCDCPPEWTPPPKHLEDSKKLSEPIIEIQAWTEERHSCFEHFEKFLGRICFAVIIVLAYFAALFRCSVRRFANFWCNDDDEGDEETKSKPFFNPSNLRIYIIHIFNS